MVAMMAITLLFGICNTETSDSSNELARQERATGGLPPKYPNKCLFNYWKVNINGRVLRKSDLTPIAGVKVYVLRNRWKHRATTNNNGEFRVRTVCIWHTLLHFRKDGFVMDKTIYRSQENLVVYATPTAPDIRPTMKFSLHPKSRTAFTGMNVTLTCEASGTPRVRYYDWFKNGKLVRGGNSLARNSNILTLSPAVAGIYQCRAVNSDMKRFSRKATITLTDGGDDTCQKSPESSIIFFPPGCKTLVNGTEQAHADVGACSSDACSTADGSTTSSESKCCGGVEYKDILVNCRHISYNMSKIVTCGCVEGSEDILKEVVTVSGQIYLVTYGPSGEEIKTPPGWPIKFTVGKSAYTAIPGGKFSFSMEPKSETIALLFTALASDTFMTQLISVNLLEGVTSYYVTVKLPPRPEPITINPTVENNVLIGPEDNKTALSVDIPAGVFVNKDGKNVNETINVHLSVIDPRNSSSLSLSPGIFQYIDNEGMEQPLVTYGVINMMTTTNSGEEVSLAGDLVLKIDSEAVGIKQDEMEHTFAWEIDEDTGRWTNPQPLIGQSDRRKKRQTDTLLKSVLKSGRPQWNLDRVHFKKLCEVAVFAYDEWKVLEVPNVKIGVHSLTSGDGLARTYHAAVTGSTGNMFGKLCGWIECDNNFELVPTEGYKPCENHNLPPEFLFRNEADNHVLGLAPPYDLILDDFGPVHREDTQLCAASGKDPDIYKYFCFTKPPGVREKSARIGGEPLPPVDDNSFYSGRVCYVQANFTVVASLSEDIDILTVSRDSEVEEKVYGQRIHGLIQSYSDGNAVADSFYSCLEVRCPSQSPAVTPHVIIQPLADQGIECTIQGLKEDLPELDIIEYTRSARVDIRLSASCSRCLEESSRLFSATYGERGVSLNQAKQIALNKCITSPPSSHVPFYRCTKPV